MAESEANMYLKEAARLVQKAAQCLPPQQKIEITTIILENIATMILNIKARL
jgi:hypothetical protein